MFNSPPPRRGTSKYLACSGMVILLMGISCGKITCLEDNKPILDVQERIPKLKAWVEKLNEIILWLRQSILDNERIKFIYILYVCNVYNVDDSSTLMHSLVRPSQYY
jgi:hypothetical protein